MDYTDDTCMNIFTINQKSRITTVMNNSPRRSTLKTSTKYVAIALFANDAEVKIENSCASGSAATCANPNPNLSLKKDSLKFCYRLWFQKNLCTDKHTCPD